MEKKKNNVKLGGAIALVSHKSPKHALSTYRLMRAQQRRAATANFQNEMQEATRRHNKKLEVERITGILTSRQPGMLHNQQYLAHRRQALLGEIASSMLS